MENFGFKKEEVLVKLDEIDIKNVHQYGFVKERYPCLTWKFEEEKPISENFLQLSSLKELLNYL
ncbi:MAG TPA: hypothetical protein DEG96_07175 [Candidatus Atribacteria bacterium]|nr:hypothetical protein [Candidatus Atribacteria bacterium]